MTFVVFATPIFNETAARFIGAIGSLPGVTLAVISQDVEENLSAQARRRVAAHFRVHHALESAELVTAARFLRERFGPIDRLLAVSEFLQVQVAEACEALGVPGMMNVATAHNFRDKPSMKRALREAGLPCARFRLVEDVAAALRFAEEVGYPLVIKPPAGVGTASTYTAKSREELLRVLAMSAPSSAAPALMEEFVTGDEHTFDAVVIGGQPVFHSITRYLPNPIEVVQNPWIQWCVLLPREIDAPVFDDIRAHGFRALSVLGMQTGVCHLEWFRRPDGGLVISEVAGRPGGAQIPVLNARAHDFDMVGELSRLMVFGTFEPPRERKYAAGVAFLRGQGEGVVVRAVHGLAQVEAELGHLVTDAKLPVIGQARAPGYEGEGYVIVRHPETRVVEEALARIVSLVRVELG